MLVICDLRQYGLVPDTDFNQKSGHTQLDFSSNDRRVVINHNCYDEHFTAQKYRVQERIYVLLFIEMTIQLSYPWRL